MIWVLLAMHVIAIPAIALTTARVGRIGLLIGTIPTTATALWAGSRLASDSNATNPPTAAIEWVSGLDLSFAFRVDSLSVLMTLLVGGIGSLVFLYAYGYFSDAAKNIGRFGATLMAFATSMQGLVWADSVWTLFVFWELTSISSFLLVGFKNRDPGTRNAARRALVLTVSGGLCLLAGFVVLVDATGTASLSAMSTAIDGGLVLDPNRASVAAALIVLAAATKSAQFPFHVWLPGAMAAPTPVSAYLHSATMVKAGILLMALASPIVGDATWWKPLGLAFGASSMLWGAVGALRHHDAKLILAWGTVSQLGLMVTLLSVGSAKATFAAVSIVFAHAIFKAALFMVVGEIDVRTGTRDINELSGLARSMPLAFTIAVLSGASMAGVPPLLGFTAKEAAVEAVLTLDGFEQLFVGAVIIGGSILTVAYTMRFVIATFGPFGSAAEQTEAGRSRLPMAIPSALLAIASVGLFLFLGTANRIVRPAAIGIDAESDVYELLRWPGLTTGLAISAVIVLIGGTLGMFVSRRATTVPRPLGAHNIDRGIELILVGARRLTTRVQHGSLPVYLATMAATAAAATTPFLFAIEVEALRWWDSPMQGVLSVGVVAAGIGTLLITSRLGAALALGSVGIGVTGLFVVHGAPDLVLTQLLVETVIVVGFVIGLGHLKQSFPSVGQVWRTARIIVSLAIGIGVSAGLAASASAPRGQPPTEALIEQAVDEGGGNNVVNVILTDIRALDTLGEIVVVAVVAVGVLALARAGGRTPSVSDPTGDPA